MNVTKNQKIGTYFKKENIFLATVSECKTDAKKLLESKMDCKVPEELIALLVDKNFISLQQFDVFYKDDTGYTRFVEEGPETFVGDNSDGKGIVHNVVPVWEYYSEDQIFECMINDTFMAIYVLDMSPLYKYNDDYNLNS